MQSSKPRAGSSDMAQRISPSTSRLTKGSPTSPDSANSKSSRPLDRKPSPKATPLSEKRAVRGSEMHQQLDQVQEELKKAREEKSTVLQDLEKMKKAMESVSSPQSAEKIKVLEREVEKTKDSERKMLESLISQTKQLEETKMELEEAKLEIRTLREGVKGLNGSAGRSCRNLEKHMEKIHKASDLAYSQEEASRLSNELKLAMEAEENSKKAMDGLALALKEVTMEMNQVKEKLSLALSEMERFREEADGSKAMVKSTEEKFQSVLVEVERLKLEADESVGVWNEKENGFINCMKVSEEEITKLKRENDRLIESHRSAREEYSKIRDIMKHAVNEATVVKEALEIARNENSQLKDLLSDKDNVMQAIRQEYECLKVSEAAALDSVKELKNLLAATSASDSSKNATSLVSTSSTKAGAVDGETREGKSVAKLPSERRRSDNTRSQNGSKGPAVRSGSFQGSMFDEMQPPQRKDRMFASLSSISDLNAPSSLTPNDREIVFYDDMDHIERTYLHGVDSKSISPTKQKKKPIFRRFGDMLRRRSFHKSEPSVIT